MIIGIKNPVDLLNQLKLMKIKSDQLSEMLQIVIDSLVNDCEFDYYFFAMTGGTIIGLDLVYNDIVSRIDWDKTIIA